MPETQGKIIVTLGTKEPTFDFEQLGVNFNSTDKEVLDALKPVLLEEEGFDITEDQEEGAFTIKRVEESGNLYIFPKSTAG